MNIPFYRFVKYDDDGHYIYQCLQCGDMIDVGDGWFGPRFCCYCGVEYKGFILKKRTEWIYKSDNYEYVAIYQVQTGYDWEDGQDIQWSDEWMKSRDAKKALELLKRAKKDEEEENKNQKHLGLGKKIFRLVRKKEKKYNATIVIDMDKYFKKTGKKYKR